MTLYPGTKSLDAEIILNFIEGTVTMDYTLNKLGSPYESSRSTVLHSEWRKEKPLTKLYYGYLGFCGTIFMFGVIAVQPIITTLVETGIIKSPTIQYKFQSLLKWCLESFGRVIELSKEGALKDTIVKFHLGMNIWFSYELSGEYQEKIKTISFLRYFQTSFKFGKYREERQNGWTLQFEFIDPPQNGSVIVKCV